MWILWCAVALGGWVSGWVGGVGELRWALQLTCKQPTPAHPSPPLQSTHAQAQYDCWTPNTAVVSLGDARQFVFREASDHAVRWQYRVANGDVVEMFGDCQVCCAVLCCAVVWCGAVWCGVLCCALVG